MEHIAFRPRVRAGTEPDGDIAGRAIMLRTTTNAMTAPMTERKSRPSIHLRAMLAPGIALGPGKADLLEGIRETGSIAAAGRRMQMSYKRAWQLAEELNRMFLEPLIEATKGGTGGGGARLTRMGGRVLACYARMRTNALAAAANDLSALRRYLSAHSR
ncbi:MAG: hypothetical protein ABIW82_10765 [Dokdonella sp.]